MDTKYIEAEKELAGLLGWEGLHIAVPWYGKDEEVCLTTPRGKVVEADVPRWTRDNATAFQLMVEHEIQPHFFTREVVIYTSDSEHVGAWYESHPDKETAVRYAIVQAVIAKLRSQG